MNDDLRVLVGFNDDELDLFINSDYKFKEEQVFHDLVSIIRYIEKDYNSGCWNLFAKRNDNAKNDWSTMAVKDSPVLRRGI